MTVKETLEGQQRREHLEHAIHEARLEGLTLAPEDRQLFDRYAGGELSREQVKQALDARYKKK